MKNKGNKTKQNKNKIKTKIEFNETMRYKMVRNKQLERKIKSQKVNFELYTIEGRMFKSEKMIASGVLKLRPLLEQSDIITAVDVKSFFCEFSFFFTILCVNTLN